MDTTPRSAAARIGTAACSAATVVTLALAGLAQAGDWVEPKRPQSAAVAVRPAEPWVQPSMDPETRSKLTTAFALAVAHVEASPECAGVFADLGADGLEILTTSLYFTAPAARRDRTCRRAAAYTYVGAPATFLCDDFPSLTDEHAAQVLIHEALHHAGLRERPSDPGALTSAAIDDMVRQACDIQFFRQDDRAR